MNKLEGLPEKEMRCVYAETLIGLVEEGRDIVVVEADLARTNGTDIFARRFPERFIDLGVAEANMISVAAGMAAMGKIPFTSSFGSFAGRRVVDQLFMAVTYSHLKIKVVGSDPGVTGGINGASHQAFEDMALMRALPDMAVLDPGDAYELRQAVREAAAYPGAVYIRLLRKIHPAVFGPDYRLKIGKGKVIKSGHEATIIASGYMLRPALEAAGTLEKQGVSVEMLNMPSVKPLDTRLVLSAARRTGAIVTAENHSVIGGLGAAVCELVAGEYPVPVRRVGMPDHCGEVGTADFLCRKFGLTAENIIRQVHLALEMKRN